MEEKKGINVKEPKGKKLSYEELQQATQQISAQLDAVVRENSQLREALKQSQMGNVFAQLEFQFKVVSNSEKFPEEFVTQCVNSIIEIMTPSKEEEEKSE